MTSSRKSRVRLQVGDVVTISLDSAGLKAYGIVLGKGKFAIFDARETLPPEEVLQHDPLFYVTVMDRAVISGRWPVLDISREHVPELTAPPTFMQDVGFVFPNSDGSSEVVRATNVSTTSEANRDTATATVPEGAQAVIHGHIDGKSDGVVSDMKKIGDFSAVEQGLPNGVVSNGRVGVNELVNGVPQFRMLQGTMSPHEIQASQANLNRVLEVFENTWAGSGQ